MEQVKAQRDRRLRRKLLAVLHAARGGAGHGYVGGIFLRDLYGDQSMARERCESDDHLIQMMRDLVMKGMAEERDGRRYKHEPFGLDYLDWRITAKGVSLMEESIAPDPDIDDRRIG